MVTEMKRLLCALLLACMLGCDTEIKIDLGSGFDRVVSPVRPFLEYPEYEPQIPRIDIEKELRQKNWRGPEGEGSCTHATILTILRHLGQEELADDWRQKYGDGEYFESLAAKLDSEGVRWAGTYRKNDVPFLEWAISTHRGCLVTCKGGAHAILLVHLDQHRAGLIDNNRPDELLWVSRPQFLSEWVNSSSWAMTIVATPPCPRPYS